jgi:cytochrome bd-type quinol oxidase subunit 2
MKLISYLIVTLLIMIVVYTIYRYTFFRPKPKIPKHHRNFTLKIEP